MIMINLLSMALRPPRLRPNAGAGRERVARIWTVSSKDLAYAVRLPEAHTAQASADWSAVMRISRRASQKVGSHQ